MNTLDVWTRSMSTQVQGYNDHFFQHGMRSSSYAMHT
jgi:hypothetical protein